MKRLSLWLPVVVLSLLLASIPFSSFAQTSFDISPESAVTASGTSNKSDWSVKAEVISGTVELTDGTPTAAALLVLVEDMKSGKAILMDRLMKGAFKSDEYPEIRFVMASSEEIEENTFDVHGHMTMAGKTNPVTFRLVRSQNADGSFVFSGDADLNMRDYDMDPPSAMFGSLLTKAEVVLHFNIVLGS